MKYQIGDRVKRPMNVRSPLRNWVWKLVTVISIYCKDQEWPWSVFRGHNLGKYDELYEVEWDNGEIKKGYLPHGIDPA